MLGVQAMKNNYKEKYNQELFVIEDCAHCLDTRMNMGGFGVNIGYNVYNNYLCYSFQAIKFLTTVDGGCLITPKETYKQAKLKRWFGIDRDSGASMRCVQKLDYVGFKFQPNDVLATIGLSNFEDSIGNQYKHRDNARYYDEQLKHERGMELVKYNEYGSSCWLYTIFVERKEDFKKMMKEKGIEVSEVHQRMDTQPIFKESKTELLYMDDIERSYICIPVGWWLTEQDRKYIVDCIKEGW
jgi:dTDP-4-amino-4,6-dideoxygalactose transaminase